jgi:two-component system OmpR family response regulator
MLGAKILIVDDEPDIVWSLRYTLADEGYDVLTAGSGADAILAAVQSRPDLVILDMVLPDLDGRQVCRTLRRDQGLAAVPILFLSRRDSVADRVDGLNSGADDYLAKPFDFGELKARIAALLRRAGRAGTTPLAEAQLTYRDLALDLRSHHVTVGKRSILLTPAEFELLRHLLSHQGEVFSSEQLLQHLWHDDEAGRDQGLVRWHVMKLRAKIEQNPAQPRYLRTVPRHGYMLGGIDS